MANRVFKKRFFFLMIECVFYYIRGILSSSTQSVSFFFEDFFPLAFCAFAVAAVDVEFVVAFEFVVDDDDDDDDDKVVLVLVVVVVVVDVVDDDVVDFAVSFPSSNSSQF